MIAIENWAALKVGRSNLPKLQRLVAADVELEHLIEIAIKQVALMVHAKS